MTKCEVVTYVENNGCLDKFSVKYDLSNIMKYINEKSLELGAKCEEKEKYFLPFSDDKNKGRVYIDISLNKYYLYSEEKPVIRDMINCLRIRKKCLDLFISDKRIILNYINFRTFNNKNVENFVDYNYAMTLNFDKMVDWLGTGFVRDFFSYFEFIKVSSFDYDDIKMGILEGVDYAKDFYIKCYSVIPFKLFMEAKKEVLDYSRLEFDKSIGLARENAKVLKL